MTPHLVKSSKKKFQKSLHCPILTFNLDPKFAPSIWTFNLDPQFGPSIWTLNLDPQFGPSIWTFWVLNLDPQFGLSIWTLNCPIWTFCQSVTIEQMRITKFCQCHPDPARPLRASTNLPSISNNLNTRQLIWIGFKLFSRHRKGLET